MQTDYHECEPEFYPFEMGYLPPAFVKKAETQLFEYPKIRESRVKEVRELLKKERLRDDWFNDEVISSFLRCRKYNVERTCSSIKNMIACVKNYPQYFRPLDPDVRDKIIGQEILRVMPRRDKSGCFIIILKLRMWNTSEIRLDDLVKCAVMLTLHALKDPMSQVNGLRFIYDFDAPVLKYIRYGTPVNSYHYYQLFLQSIPLRVTSLNVVNPNAIAKLAISLLYAVASEKLKRKLVFANDSTELLQQIQANVLPVEYGGLLTKEECQCSWTKTMSMPSYVTTILDSVGKSKCN